MSAYPISAAVECLCPGCGADGHAQAGQTTAGRRGIRWYRSIACPYGGRVEEDGMGAAPEDIRQALIEEHGQWSVRVLADDKVRAVHIVRKALSLERGEAAKLMNSFPLIPVGTKVEAYHLSTVLEAAALRAEAIRS